MSKKILMFIVILFSAIVFSQEKKVELRDIIQAFQKNEFDLTIELASRAIKEGLDQPDLYFYLGMAYAKIGKNQEAIQAFRTFLNNTDYSKNQWNIRQAFQNLVNIYRDAKKFESTVEDGVIFLEKMKVANNTEQLQLFCKNIIAEALKEIGNQRSTSNDFVGAIEAYKRALEYKPDDPSSYVRIAIYYKNLGENELAAKYFLKSATLWSAWSGKISPLFSATELIWESGKFEEFAGIVENDPFSYNFLLAMAEMKKHKFQDAFLRIKKIEESAGSNGNVSERILKNWYKWFGEDANFFYCFVVAFPEHQTASWAIDMMTNVATRDSDTAKVIREKIVPSLAEFFEKNKQSPGVKKLFPKLVDLKFAGIPETAETAREKIKMYEELKEKVSDEDVIQDIIRREASLYADILSDYAKGKELYELLVNRYKQKSAIQPFAKCLINLEQFDQAYQILTQYLSDKSVGEYGRFQAAQLLIQANFFDEGIKILNEIASATKNRSMIQQVKDILKNFKLYLKDDTMIESATKFVVLNLNKKKYYFTNFTSLTEDCALLFQETEMLEIIPFATERKYVDCDIECISDDEISLTEPYTMIFQKDNKYFVKLKRRISFSPDRWRKSEGISLIFPWHDITTNQIKVVRNYSTEGEFGISSISFEKLKPGMRIEVYFSTRAGRFESVLPESSEPGPGGAMIFQPSDEKFEVKIKFKPNADLLAYYPRVRVIMEDKTEPKKDESSFPLSLRTDKTEFRITFGTDLRVHSILRTDEIVYEIDEKIDI
ncbi:MAG TPA: tetratricopeptide repeat protein [bacterium]|nr:tetratricopeptide repeat protein [bacterium]HOL34801.1 tetratricopeptide repeat protein [bacterium]HPP08256.1 tetratricopeptide repeat protein [bacterium]